MDENSTRHKRRNSPQPNSPRKTSKVDYKTSKQTRNLSPQKMTETGNFHPNSSSSIDSKMSNITKLKQQFVEEIKDIEHSMKETIKNLKQKISDTNKKAEIIRDKLRQGNQLLCNQSEIIYNKEQENRVLREKVEELYEYQKIIFENMEDISNTLNIHENLSNRLANEYDNVILIQANNNKKLEDELKKIGPDEKYCLELKQINMKIHEQERINFHKKNEIHKLESEFKAFKREKDENSKELENLEKKIKELEIRNENSKLRANKEKTDMMKELEDLKKEDDIQTSLLSEADKTINEMETKLNTNRNLEENILKQITDINNEINLLRKEQKELEEKRFKEDEQNQIILDKFKDHLKASKLELTSIKQKENQAINLLQRKNADLRSRLKSYENVEIKLKKYEAEIKKEEDFMNQMIIDAESKKKEHDIKIKSSNEKVSDVKEKLKNLELEMSKSEEKIKTLEKEVEEINKKIDQQSKMTQKENDDGSVVRKMTQYGLPDLFAAEELGSRENEKHRKKLYTPTLADDDLEIDSLSLEEQFTHLTQTKSSQSDSPEKGKKFFKRSTPSQSKTRKESTPRGRGRGKKNI